MTTPDNRALWELVEKWRRDASISRSYPDSFNDGWDSSKQTCADELAAILERPVVIGGWLPIESAPKDGTKILVPLKDGDVVISWWTHGIRRGWRDGWLEYIGEDGIPVLLSTEPIYWMPLPDEPETDESMVRGKS